jgi:type IV pilus assembly protein PilF
MRIWKCIPAMAALAAMVMLAVGCATTLDEPDRRKMVSHRDLGTLYLQRGELELAIREYRAAISIWDRDAETHFAIGEAYRQKAAFESAELHFLRALELEPGLHDARLNLGALYLQQERWEDAIATNQVLADDPTFMRPARALVNLGWAQYKSGNRADAEKSFRSAVASDGFSYQGRLNLGIVLYDREEFVEAIRHFSKVLELIDGRPEQVFGAAEAEARFRMAMAHVRLGQRQRAIEQLRVAVDRGGETEWADKSRDYLAVLE